MVRQWLEERRRERNEEGKKRSVNMCAVELGWSGLKNEMMIIGVNGLMWNRGGGSVRQPLEPSLQGPFMAERRVVETV